MVILKGRTLPPSGDIHWHQLDFRDSDVFTILVDRLPEGSRTATIPGVLYPQVESKAWGFDLDAVREALHPTLSRGIPPWASGWVNVEPTSERGVLRFDITPEMLA